jgi:2-keto-4-pentenoate hydratase
MAAKKAEAVVERVREVRLTVPLAELEDGYAARHVDLQLTQRQRKNLRRLRVALHERGEKIQGRSGQQTRHVDSAADAVRWLLERLE